MGVEYRILQDIGLVYVSHVGVVRASESREAFRQYLRDPQFRPGQRHLVDVSELTHVEFDPVGQMSLQMTKLEAFVGSDCQTLMAYYSPSLTGYEAACRALKPWRDVDQVATLQHFDQSEILTFLGLRERTIADLLAAETARNGCSGSSTTAA